MTLRHPLTKILQKIQKEISNANFVGDPTMMDGV